MNMSLIRNMARGSKGRRNLRMFEMERQLRIMT